VLERLASVLRRVELTETSGLPPAPGDTMGSGDQGVQTPKEVAPEAPIKLSQLEQKRQHSREKRKALFEAVRAAHQRGVTKGAIAREFGITRLTVRQYLRAKEFPERAPRQRRSELDSFRRYLEKRWAEGCHNASQLCPELRQQGYGGRRSRVKEYVQPWRSSS
jgi:predicted transcriptional regulator